MDLWKPKAYLNTGDNLNGNLKFYAINGWLDIITSGHIGSDFNQINDGMIYCKQNYTQNCPFTQTDCICNNPLITSISSTSTSSSSSTIVSNS